MTQVRESKPHNLLSEDTKALIIAGLVAWPIAAGAGFAGLASEQGNVQNMLQSLFLGVVAATLLTGLPAVSAILLKQARRLTRLQIGAPLAVGLTLLAGIFFTTSLFFYMLYGLVIQLIAFIPACGASVLLGRGVLWALSKLKARSFLAMALGGALGGLVPASGFILHRAYHSEPYETLTSFSAGVVGFWCVGGLVAAVTVWGWRKWRSLPEQKEL